MIAKDLQMSVIKQNESTNNETMSALKNTYLHEHTVGPNAVFKNLFVATTIGDVQVRIRHSRRTRRWHSDAPQEIRSVMHNTHHII